MGSVDPYGLLGVKHDASPKDIQKAYRRLAKQWHPDVNPGNTEAKNKFQDITAAYELLRNEETRAVTIPARSTPRSAVPQRSERRRSESVCLRWRAAGCASFDDPDDHFSTIFSRRSGPSIQLAGWMCRIGSKSTSSMQSTARPVA